MRKARGATGIGERLALALVHRKRDKLFAFSHEMNVSPSTVSRWLQGRTITLDHAARIAVALDISLDWLVLGRGEMPMRGSLRPETPLLLAEIVSLLPREARDTVVAQLEQTVRTIRRKDAPPSPSEPHFM